MYAVGDDMPVPQVSDGYRSDRVDFTQAFDLSDLFTFEELWDPDIVTNQSLHRYVPPGSQFDPFSFDSEGLLITANRVNPAQNRGQEWASGILSTRENPALRLRPYGYAEVTMRLPLGAGMWPAWWFLPYWPVDEDWPEEYTDFILPEVDALEHTNLYGSDTYQSTIHSYGTVEKREPCVLTSTEFRHQCPPSYNFTNDFHTWSIKREPDVVLFGLDGKIMNVQPRPVDAILQDEWVMFINLAVGGSWVGIPSPQVMQRSLEVAALTVINRDTVFDSMGGNSDLIKSLNMMQAQSELLVMDTMNACQSDLKARLGAMFEKRRRELGG